MLKNFDLPLTDFEGNVVPDGEKTRLLRSVIIDAVNGAADTSTIDGEEKFKRGKLIEKIFAGGEVDVTAEEIVLMKKCVGSRGDYTPLAVMKVYEFLEG